MMAPKKALAPRRVPRQPAGLPPPALLAKPKALLVPKLPGWAAHQAEQHRRMAALLAGSWHAEAAEDEAAEDEAWTSWADAYASKEAKKGEGFDGSGTPDPFKQNDADQGDEAEEGRKGVWAYLDDDDDDSLVQGASKVAKKDDGFNQNDDDPVDSDPEGWAEMAKAVPQKFLLKEFARRCPR
jgi:hypothetical protein